MTAFVGLDLAWTPHHETGVCVLETGSDGVELRELCCGIKTPEDFAAMCLSFGDDVVVAVDAPLVVKTGRRAEAELGKVYGKYHAGAYTATMAFLTKMNGLAGPDLAVLLRAADFELDPRQLTVQAPGRFALEVFPHPAHVSLFRLEMALKYKKGRVAHRKTELSRYQSYLVALLAPAAPRVLASDPVQRLLGAEALLAKGTALKCLEDRLDALTCAYVAYHCWQHGRAGFELFGCTECGCIVVPNRVQQA